MDCPGPLKHDWDNHLVTLKNKGCFQKQEKRQGRKNVIETRGRDIPRVRGSLGGGVECRAAEEVGGWGDLRFLVRPAIVNS